MPIDLAASTNGSSRSASVLARITRATVGISGIAIAMIMLGSDGPSAAVMTSASTSSGRACSISVTRWNTRSTQPEQITGHQADHDADRRAERGRADADGERDARAVDDPAPDVAAERIGSEPVLRASGSASAMRGIDAERIVTADDVGEAAASTNSSMMHRPMAPSR